MLTLHERKSIHICGVSQKDEIIQTRLGLYTKQEVERG